MVFLFNLYSTVIIDAVWMRGELIAIKRIKSGDADAANRTGMELGWKTSIGATSFEVAYGSWTDDDNGGGDSASDIEIEMKYSF